MLTLAKYSFGVGDRFAHQAGPNCGPACWLPSRASKSCRSGTNRIANTRSSARSPTASAPRPTPRVRKLGWGKAYHVDADHIRLETVDGFSLRATFTRSTWPTRSANRPSRPQCRSFVERHPELARPRLAVAGVAEPLDLSAPRSSAIAGKYLRAVQEAGRIYRHIAAAKGADRFITEVSMDETDSPQTPPELLVILAALADEQVPMQTIAPKFTGRFNKGVDYVGDVGKFEKEFQDDLAVIAFAIQQVSGCRTT